MDRARARAQVQELLRISRPRALALGLLSLAGCPSDARQLALETPTQPALAPQAGPGDAPIMDREAGADAPGDAAALDDTQPTGDGAMTDAAAAAPRDADLPDAAPCTDSLPAYPTPPALLSQTGLYAEIAQKRVAASLLPFEPQFELWSDGASKARWMYLPECAGPIDTRDMDDWGFPVGARAFKEFAVDGKRIETRFVYRHGSGPDDMMFAHYLWNDDETEATLVDASTPREALHHPKGTDYVVPTPELCTACHGQRGGPPGGLPARFLGFTAVQLSHQGTGATMRSLSESGKLSRPLPGGHVLLGDPTARAAVGYLHANCGFCHHEGAEGVSFPASPLSLLLTTGDRTLEETGVYRTALGVEIQGYQGSCDHRLFPGDPGLQESAQTAPRSCFYERMASRTQGVAMPPLLSHRVDPDGLSLLRSFLLGLTN